MKNIRTATFCLILTWLLAGIALAAEPEKELVIRVATDASSPPMSMLDHNDHIVGFDIDVMNAIATEAGFKVIIQNTTRKDMFTGLADDRYDAVIGSVVIGEPDNNGLDFSDPYLGSYGIAVKNGNAPLLELINKGIRAVKSKGIDQKLKKRWLK